MPEYPLIAEHGLIGDLQTAALVTTDGTVDWLCVPRFDSPTLDAMGETLVSDSLAYRYDPSASPDGLRGSEGTFSMCTFWYVQALAHSGRLRRARVVFEKMHTYANHLGLFSEEIGPTGEQLGNIPQAFTHPALIHTAAMLGERLDSAGADEEDAR